MDEHPLWTTDLSVRQAYSEDASGLIAVPDAVARPANEEEIVEIVRHCHAHSIPLTAQGLRSSTVAGPLAFGGVAMSLERMGRVVDIDTVNRLAILEPGVNLGEFKRSLRGSGLFYPPDPTSEDECTIGGSVMANASGSHTYRYGPTRPYVRALRVVLGDGRVDELARSRSSKNTTGYFGFQNPVDLLVGSEGTLGILTRVTVDLLPEPPAFFAGMAFFRALPDALDFVLAADRENRAATEAIHAEDPASRGTRLAPRCLELFDEGSLDLIRPAAARLNIPAGARAAIYFEQECEAGREDEAFEAWYRLLEQQAAMADDTIVATTDERKGELRKLRHALPTEMNERGQSARATGGRKLSTDWAVPLDFMPRAIEEATRIAEETFGGFFIRYGHIGNGHPHFNLLAEDPESLARARAATHRMARLAIEMGGTVTAEHGIGKIKREYLRYQYPAWVVEAMRAVKRTLDPGGILAPGNIFE
jgi:FAD/FMN-containing dehydrogenase